MKAYADRKLAPLLENVQASQHHESSMNADVGVVDEK